MTWWELNAVVGGDRAWEIVKDSNLRESTHLRCAVLEVHVPKSEVSATESRCEVSWSQGLGLSCRIRIRYCLDAIDTLAMWREQLVNCTTINSFNVPRSFTCRVVTLLEDRNGSVNHKFTTLHRWPRRLSNLFSTHFQYCSVLEHNLWRKEHRFEHSQVYYLLCTVILVHWVVQSNSRFRWVAALWSWLADVMRSLFTLEAVSTLTFKCSCQPQCFCWTDELRIDNAESNQPFPCILLRLRQWNHLTKFLLEASRNCICVRPPSSLRRLRMAQESSSSVLAWFRDTQRLLVTGRTPSLQCWAA